MNLARYKTEYLGVAYNGVTTYDCQIQLPLVNISASVGHGAYALGYQTAFDAGEVTK